MRTKLNNLVAKHSDALIAVAIFCSQIGPMTQTTAALIVCQFFLHMQLKHKPAATDLLNKMDEYSMVVRIWAALSDLCQQCCEFKTTW